jgi:8-oxo-dGTP diphosphatase
MSETTAGDRYVVGFMFNPTEDAVLLIRKTHPTWQAGKLNGVGGRIDGNESALDAMQREFLEEVGIDHPDWKQFCVLGDARHWQIHFFSATGLIGVAEALTDERPEVHCVSALPVDTIPNLHWLIPMALSMKRETISGFSITEVRKPL